MIEAMALVINVEQHRVWVASLQTGGCGACSQKAHCTTHAVARLLKKKPVAVEVDSTQRLNVGDHVMVAIDESVLLLSTLLMYLFPLMALFIGAGLVDGLVPDATPAKDAWLATGALTGLLLSLWLIHRAHPLFLFTAYARPTVVKKLPSANHECLGD